MTDYLVALLHREAFESNHSTRLHTAPPAPPFGHIAHDWVQLPEATPLQSRSGRVTDAQEGTLPSETLWNRSFGVDAEPDDTPPLEAPMTTVTAKLPNPAMVKVPGPTMVNVVAWG